MTTKTAQALEVVRLAFNATRRTDLRDAEILEAINRPIYPHRVADRVKPNK
jgi:hypothetical protein